MNILILGASQVGISIAEVLVGEENDVTIVDVDKPTLSQLQNRLDIHTVAGNAAHPSVLRCLLYTSPSPRDLSTSRMPSSA